MHVRRHKQGYTAKQKSQFTCPMDECNQSYSTKDGLKKHILTVHSVMLPSKLHYNDSIDSHYYLIIMIIMIMIRFVARTYPPCWVLKARIQKHRGKPLLFHDKCPGFFYVHYTTHGTYIFTSHPKDEAIMVRVSVLLKDTSAATGQAGIRTHILATPELESNALDRSATTLQYFSPILIVLGCSFKLLESNPLLSGKVFCSGRSIVIISKILYQAKYVLFYRESDTTDIQMQLQLQLQPGFHIYM